MSGGFNLKLSITKQRGFTFVELLVAVSIFLVILLLTIANLRIGNQTNELRLKGQELAEVIRQVQNNALVSLPVNGVTPDRFGIHFTSSTNGYFLFKETIGSGTDNYLYDSLAPGETIQKFVMDGKRFIINGMNDPENPCGIKVKPGVMDIVFTVPDGRIYFNGVQPDNSCGNYNPGWIELKYIPTGKSVDISVNWISGRISVSDLLN